jgi:hypothetical protein
VLAVVWALLVEYVGGGSVATPGEVEQVLDGRVSQTPEPATPSLDTWGTSAEAQAGIAAMMAL